MSVYAYAVRAYFRSCSRRVLREWALDAHVPQEYSSFTGDDFPGALLHKQPPRRHDNASILSATKVPFSINHNPSPKGSRRARYTVGKHFCDGVSSQRSLHSSSSSSSKDNTQHRNTQFNIRSTGVGQTVPLASPCRGGAWHPNLFARILWFVWCPFFIHTEGGGRDRIIRSCCVETAIKLTRSRAIRRKFSSASPPRVGCPCVFHPLARIL